MPKLGAPRPIYDLPEELAAAISSLEIVKRGTKDGNGAEYVYKLRLWDEIRARELLGRHLGMFSGRVEVTGKGWRSAAARAHGRRTDRAVAG